MNHAKWKCRWWLFSKDAAMMLGYYRWHWRPIITATWQKPTAGMAGNYLRTELVTLSIEWLSAYIEFQITPEGSK